MGLAGEIEGLGLDRWRLIGLLGKGEAELVGMAGGRLPVIPQDGGHGLCVHDDRFPGRIGEVLAAPRALYVVGGVGRFVDLLRGPVVAVVGSRRSTYYGREFAFGLARDLARAGVTVLSGLADGIEGAVVHGVLAGGGRPVVAMAGGAGVALPVQQDRLHARLVREGVAVSELPVGFAAPRAWCFLTRGRVIAGLADAVVVVEAGIRSGTMLTADLALRMGRGVGVVPGRASDECAGGSNELLRDGATVVLGVEDVLGLVDGRQAGGFKPTRPR